MLQPIVKRNRMFEQVLEKIYDYITSGNLVEGDKLMTEREMAYALQVSRSSIREALRILDMFGIIHSKPGEGTILRAPELSKILSEILPFLRLPSSTIVELLESQKVLEGGIAKLAAKRRKDKDIQFMEEAIDRMKNNQNLEALIQADLDFHLNMAKAAYNNTLSDILVVVADTVMQNLYATRFRMFMITGVNDKLVEQHTLILNALKERNQDHAQREIEHHLDFSIEIIKSLEENIT